MSDLSPVLRVLRDRGVEEVVADNQRLVAEVRRLREENERLRVATDLRDSDSRGIQIELRSPDRNLVYIRGTLPPPENKGETHEFDWTQDSTSLELLARPESFDAFQNTELWVNKKLWGSLNDSNDAFLILKSFDNEDQHGHGEANVTVGGYGDVFIGLTFNVHRTQLLHFVGEDYLNHSSNNINLACPLSALMDLSPGFELSDVRAIQILTEALLFRR
jgi:hypothetical protein